jgi:hypothetical protein
VQNYFIVLMRSLQTTFTQNATRTMQKSCREIARAAKYRHRKNPYFTVRFQMFLFCARTVVACRARAQSTPIFFA